MSFQRWFTPLRQASAPKANLLLFHYAGGNSGIYRALSQWITQPVNIMALDLPGRARRFNEPLIDDLHVAADEIAKAMLAEKSALAALPMILFGHSVGAKLAFEVTLRLQRKGMLTPRHLIVSGSGAPHIPRSRPPLHALAQDQFIEELRRYGGTPEPLLEEEDLLQLLIPMLRSDFKMAELYRHHSSPHVNCSLTAFGGDDDETVELSSLHAWSEHAGASFDTLIFPGGHFFLHQQGQAVARAMDKVLEGI